MWLNEQLLRFINWNQFNFAVGYVIIFRKGKRDST